MLETSVDCDHAADAADAGSEIDCHPFCVTNQLSSIVEMVTIKKGVGRL